jgi:hypothetical protein
MRTIFPMAPEAVRQGLVKKRMKEARRAQEAQERALSMVKALAQPFPEVAGRPARNPLARHNRRRKREAKRKAEARRLKAEMSVSTAVKDLLKATRDSGAIIARLPRDQWGRIRVYDDPEGGEETTSSRKPSSVFRRFTFAERRALSAATRKYRAAATRLSVSVTAAWSVWEATLAAYKHDDLVRSTAKHGGIL